MSKGGRVELFSAYVIFYPLYEWCCISHIYFDIKALRKLMVPFENVKGPIVAALCNMHGRDVCRVKESNLPCKADHWLQLSPS